MKTFLLLILLAAITFGVKANTQKSSFIEGVVLNNQTGDPLPNVNIYIKDTGIGTTTNFEGKFLLEYPNYLKNKVLEISHIGMKKITFPVNTIHSSLFMFLEQEFEKIDEVYIMPDKAIKTYIKDSYNRIKKNYSRKTSMITGIYRENLFAYDSIPLYFAEAMTNFYKPGITKNKDIGQAKIIKSRKRIFPAHDSLNHILFNRGIYLPNDLDVVKNRLEFINPSNSDKYYYKIDELATRNGKKVIAIYFHTNNGALDGMYEGKMYIDRETYAYLEFEYTLNKKGLAEFNFYKNNPYQRQNVKIKVKYKKFNGKYHLLHL